LLAIKTTACAGSRRRLALLAGTTVPQQVAAERPRGLEPAAERRPNRMQGRLRYVSWRFHHANHCAIKTRLVTFPGKGIFFLNTK